ncbi:hypothetical protein FBU30_005195 [Linnemannia zychae]|nr:hypothetical protein FBU30_005195 [Linnemannia zychae]
MSSTSLSEWNIIHRLSSDSEPTVSRSGSRSNLSPTPAPVLPQCQQEQQQTTTYQKSQSLNNESLMQQPLFPSRPNSIASSYQPALLSRKNSQRSHLRQLDQNGMAARASVNNNQYEKESNDAFERICSLLTHLITDASTAVGTTEENNDSAKDSVIFPRYLPLVYSGSEDSEDDDILPGAEDQANTMMIQENSVEEDSIFDDEFYYEHLLESPRDQRLRRINNSKKKPLTRNRTRSYITSPSKRTSLFLELQNLQMEPQVDQHPTTPTRINTDTRFNSNQSQETKPLENLHLSDSINVRQTLNTTASATISFSPTTPSTTFDFECFSSELGSPMTLTPRRRASFPPRRSDQVQHQRAEELQRMIQCVDAELDRTVETIDDLTCDLVAIATHQSWIKTHLEQTLGLKNPLSLVDIVQCNDTSNPMEGVISGSPISPISPRGRLERMEDIIEATKALLSSKEFAHYYQVLEKVRHVKQDLFEDHHQSDEKSNDIGDQKNTTCNDQQRLSDTSFTLTNSSYRHSSSSILSLDTRFGSFTDFKDGTQLSGSSRPSIEWSDKIGAVCSTELSQDKIHPFTVLHSQVQKQQEQQQFQRQQQQTPVFPPMSLLTQESNPTIKNPEIQDVIQEKPKQKQKEHGVPDGDDSSRHKEQDNTNEDDMSLNATLVIDKLILTCTHISLLLFWAVVLIMGVLITDGSILGSAGRQLISSVEVLQNHFAIRQEEDVDNLGINIDSILQSPVPQPQSSNPLLDQEHIQEQEHSESLLSRSGDGVLLKSNRPYYSSLRRRTTRPSSQRHPYHHVFLRRKLSSLIRQMNATGTGGTFKGISLGDSRRFYNSPFLASSRYDIDISQREPRTIQLTAPIYKTPFTSAASATHLVPILRSPSAIACSLSIKEPQDPASTMSSASSSATLLDWLDSTSNVFATPMHLAVVEEKQEVQACTASPLPKQTPYPTED